MGLGAARAAVKFAKIMGATTIVDPFCGQGTSLAVANYYGLNSIGVDISPKLVRKSTKLDVKKQMDELEEELKKAETMKQDMPVQEEEMIDDKEDED
jgi:tRNA G10  N-methylase Trm11